MPAAFFDTVILGFEVRILFILNCSKCTLDQQGFQVNACPGDPAALLLAGALVILRGKPGPGAEMLCGFKDRHVAPDFGNDITGRGFSNAGDIGGKADQIVIGFGEFCDSIVQSADDGRKVVGVFPAEFHLECLVIGDFIANDRGNNTVSLIFSPTKKKGFAILRVKILSGKQVFDNRGSRFPKSVGKDRAECNVGDSEGILEPHLLAGALIDKFVTVTVKFPELTDFLHRDVAGGNDVKLEKVDNPHGIFVVSFLPLNGPDVLRVGNNDMEMGFKDIENRDPVFTGGFHTDLSAVVFQEPVAAGNEVRIKGSEPLFLISGNAFEVSGSDTDGDKFFVDVHTGTVVMNDTQHKKPPFKRSRN